MQLTNWQEAKEKELFVSCVQAKHYQGNFNMLSAIIILLSLLIFTLTPGFGHAFTLSNNIPQKYYLDNDGDGKGGTTVRDIYVDGLDLPPVLHQFSNTYVLDNGDCDDNNPHISFQCGYKNDLQALAFKLAIDMNYKFYRQRHYLIPESDKIRLYDSIDNYLSVSYLPAVTEIVVAIADHMNVNLTEAQIDALLSDMLKSPKLAGLLGWSIFLKGKGPEMCGQKNLGGFMSRGNKAHLNGVIGQLGSFSGPGNVLSFTKGLRGVLGGLKSKFGNGCGLAFLGDEGGRANKEGKHFQGMGPKSDLNFYPKCNRDCDKLIADHAEWAVGYGFERVGTGVATIWENTGQNAIENYKSNFKPGQQDGEKGFYDHAKEYKR